ncbi:hypothetical protein D9M71_411510 [compost metagenome]
MVLQRFCSLDGFGQVCHRLRLIATGYQQALPGDEGGVHIAAIEQHSGTIPIAMQFRGVQGLAGDIQAALLRGDTGALKPRRAEQARGVGLPSELFETGQVMQPYGAVATQIGHPCL